MLQATSYVALILDLGLPERHGLELLSEIRQHNDPIPVLVLTARGGLQDRIHGQRSGADDYLPFALEDLIARLEAQLRRPGRCWATTCGFDTRTLLRSGRGNTERNVRVATLEAGRMRKRPRFQTG